MAGEATTPPADEAIADVGIPTLGLTPYLLESIESVLNQTLSSWRLVISENGPGDDRLHAALEPYLRDSRVSHVVTGERLGRGENYTRLIRAGKAPYVGLLHDDDRWGSQFLERRVAFLEKNAGCGIVFSGYAVIDEQGRRIAASKLDLAEGVHKSAEIFPKLYRRMFIATPSVLVRRSAYEATGARYKEIVFTDHEMWLRLSAHFDVGYIATGDADYRFHTAQTSSDRIGDAKQSLLVLDAVEDLPIPPRIRRAGRAEAIVWCALDSVELGERGQAFRYLAQAIRTDPVCLVRPATTGRILAAAAAMATGSRGMRAFSNVRGRRWQTRRRRGISFAAQMDPVSPADAAEADTGT
jgi:hypothetical protein